ncbi:hypothetical protein [Faecalibacterium prausnitzii]|jgi:hypothetical protein|uniref:hypothetical protein n=1 Tax=Faecalibacterium prausnitzii TaxID=853 RepID=UPI0012E2BB2F|nr:hypothetical protein [Faecalibacterium prausnitzii]
MRNKKLYKRLVALILAGCVVVGSSAVGFATGADGVATQAKCYHIGTGRETINYKAATCIEKGYSGDIVCKECGAVVTKGIPLVENLLNHGNNRELRNAKDATCTENGYTGDTYCNDCGWLVFLGKNIEAPGHDYKNVAEVPATCVAEGTAATQQCKRCDYIVPAQSLPIDPKNHANIVKDVAVAPTCTETGLTEGSHCGDCNKILIAQEVVSSTNHTEVIDPAVAATCTETGLTEGSHCSVCNKILVAQKTVSALNHSFTNYISNDDATCTEDGTKTAKCDRCDVTDTQSDEGSAKGHTSVVDAAVAPTYSSVGLTEGSHCADCGLVFKEQEVIPALVPDTNVDFHLNQTGVLSSHRVDVATGAQKDAPALQAVTSAYTNFSGLTVFHGTLANGERIMTVALIGSDGISEVDITLNVVVNTDVVAGYRLMLVNADGTETELSVGSGNGKSSFALNFANGAQIIHLVPIAE